jgi:hypothetical protein
LQEKWDTGFCGLSGDFVRGENALFRLASAFFFLAFGVSRFGTSQMNSLDILRSGASYEFVEVVAVRAVFAKIRVVEQPLYAAACADSVGVVLVMSDGPAHVGVPASAKEHGSSGS